MALAGDWLFVSDSGSDSLHRLDADSIFTQDVVVSPPIGSGYGNDPGCLVAPGDLCVSNGQLFVAEAFGISVFDVGTMVFNHRWGTQESSLGREGADSRLLRGGTGPGQFKGVGGLAEHGSELFVADMGNHRIQVFEGSTGTFRRMFGKKGSRPGELNKPNGLAIARGRLVVSEFTGKRIQVVTREEGAPLQLITRLSINVGLSEWTQNARPGAFCVDEEAQPGALGGRLYVTASGPAAPLHTFQIIVR